MFGKRFRLARETRGLTLRRMADALGISPQAISQWEKGNPNLSISRINQVSKYLGVSIEWLEGHVGTDTEIWQQNQIKDGMQKNVPLLLKEDILMRHYQILSNELSTSAFEEYVYPTVNLLGGGFACFAAKDEMDPFIIDGDLLIFDNEGNPTNGDIVCAFLVKDGTASTVVRKYEYLGESSKKQEVYIQLHSYAPDIPPITLNRDCKGFIIAVLVEMRRFRQG